MEQRSPEKEQKSSKIKRLEVFVQKIGKENGVLDPQKLLEAEVESTLDSLLQTNSRMVELDRIVLKQMIEVHIVKKIPMPLDHYIMNVLYAALEADTSSTSHPEQSNPQPTSEPSVSQPSTSQPPPTVADSSTTSVIRIADSKGNITCISKNNITPDGNLIEAPESSGMELKDAKKALAPVEMIPQPEISSLEQRRAIKDRCLEKKDITPVQHSSRCSAPILARLLTEGNTPPSSSPSYSTPNECVTPQPSSTRDNIPSTSTASPLFLASLTPSFQQNHLSPIIDSSTSSAPPSVPASPGVQSASGTTKMDENFEKMRSIFQIIWVTREKGFQAIEKMKKEANDLEISINSQQISIDATENQIKELKKSQDTAERLKQIKEERIEGDKKRYERMREEIEKFQLENEESLQNMGIEYMPLYWSLFNFQAMPVTPSDNQPSTSKQDYSTSNAPDMQSADAPPIESPPLEAPPTRKRSPTPGILMAEKEVLFAEHPFSEVSLSVVAPTEAPPPEDPFSEVPPLEIPFIEAPPSRKQLLTPEVLTAEQEASPLKDVPTEVFTAEHLDVEARPLKAPPLEEPLLEALPTDTSSLETPIAEGHHFPEKPMTEEEEEAPITEAPRATEVRIATEEALPTEAPPLDDVRAETPNTRGRTLPPEIAMAEEEALSLEASSLEGPPLETPVTEAPPTDDPSTEVIIIENRFLEGSSAEATPTVEKASKKKVRFMEVELDRMDYIWSPSPDHLFFPASPEAPETPEPPILDNPTEVQSSSDERIQSSAVSAPPEPRESLIIKIPVGLIPGYSAVGRQAECCASSYDDVTEEPRKRLRKEKHIAEAGEPVEKRKRGRPKKR